MIWKGKKANDPDCFTVTLSVKISSLERVSTTPVASDGHWTQIAHSDHNPPDAHDIYDPNDNKGLHVDVEHPTQDRYRTVYKKLANGNPPEPTGASVSLATDLLEKKCCRFLSDYLGK